MLLVLIVYIANSKYYLIWLDLPAYFINAIRPLAMAALAYVIRRVQKFLKLPNFVSISVKIFWGGSRTPFQYN